MSRRRSFIKRTLTATDISTTHSSKVVVLHLHLVKHSRKHVKQILLRRPILWASWSASLTPSSHFHKKLLPLRKKSNLYFIRLSATVSRIIMSVLPMYILKFWSFRNISMKNCKRITVFWNVHLNHNIICTSLALIKTTYIYHRYHGFPNVDTMYMIWKLLLLRTMFVHNSFLIHITLLLYF